jgi:hypothetical protein
MFVIEKIKLNFLNVRAKTSYDNITDYNWLQKYTS